LISSILKIMRTPKSVVDRGIEESLADFKAGCSYGPFKSARDLVASLRREAIKMSPTTPRGSTAAAPKG
jgi:hypothetical protein